MPNDPLDFNPSSPPIIYTREDMDSNCDNCNIRKAEHKLDYYSQITNHYMGTIVLCTPCYEERGDI